MIAFGAFFGPLIGGLLVEYIGFLGTTSFLGVLLVGYSFLYFLLEGM